MSMASRTFPEDLERAAITLEDERPVELAPRKEPATPAEWIRANLLSTWFNGIVTVASVTAIAYVGYRLLRWVFVTAEWQVVRSNLRVYIVGRFPLEEVWRVWVVGWLAALLAGLSWGASGRRLGWTMPRTVFRAVVAASVVGSFVYLLDGVRIWLLVLGTVALVGAGVAIGRGVGRGVRRPLLLAWALAFPAAMLVLRGFGGVPPQLWGGFFLNVVVAVVGVFVSFPFGILLALGRRSSLPAVSLVSVAVIELIRGVPLFTLIIAGQFILPLMLPPGMALAEIVRMMLVFTIFSSAYVAEIVRGGLQGVHHDQYDAARALGLSTTRMMAVVILPQALRSTIPAMISHFISVFKDTSLLAALAITELLRAGRRASAQLEFIGTQKEALLAAALIFWVVAFAMSRWSQRLERRLGVGER
jgi:general L-amino acid transport system permease protein